MADLKMNGIVLPHEQLPRHLSQLRLVKDSKLATSNLVQVELALVAIQQIDREPPGAATGSIEIGQGDLVIGSEAKTLKVQVAEIL